jgi:uncharacterized membrane protein
MNKRTLVALGALAGVFVALYLTLYKLGYIGTLACAVGSCETVQTSRWAVFLGFPVGGWGVGYYIVVLALGLAGLTPRLADSVPLSRVLVGLTTFGLLFSLWLTYLELFVIHAICMWCVGSAIIAALLCVLSWLDLRDVTLVAEEAVLADAAEQLREGHYGDEIRRTPEVASRAVEDSGDEEMRG